MSSLGTEFSLNFADVEDQKEFTVLPAGKYHVMVTDGTVDTIKGEDAQNPGEPNIRWEFTVQSGEYENRKLWDSTVVVATAMWKLKALLAACGFDVSGEVTFDVEEVKGSQLDVKVGTRPKRTDPKTGNEYQAQNRVNAFFPHEPTSADLLP